MPELPEVELVARHLGELITGRVIERARLLRAGLAPDHPPAQFARLLRGARFEDVARRGKHILAHLDTGQTLITHLRMSGRFLYLNAASPAVPHTHAVFDFDDGHRLLFTDQRHFGLMRIAPQAGLESLEMLSKLGPEPFDQSFDDSYLRAALGGSRQSIKLFLLDQTRLAGLGNIYAAEALHRAGINPQRPAAEISGARAARLRRAILEVLSEAIAAGSTLRVDPRELDAAYVGGEYEKSWRVYDREGEPCPVCRASIRRFTQGGRSTYYCPRCQRR
jgi:formamidopyrimidine-DNA glycosylase